MRIDNTTPVGLVSTPTKASRQHSLHHGQDQVKLSIAASGDPQKIERLTAAVAAGTYRVSAFQVAGSLINEMIAAL